MELVEDRPPYLTEFRGADVCGHVKSADGFFSMVLGTNGDAAVGAIGSVPHLGGFGQRVPRMMKHLASASTCKSFQEKIGAFAQSEMFDEFWKWQLMSLNDLQG